RHATFPSSFRTQVGRLVQASSSECFLALPGMLSLLAGRTRSGIGCLLEGVGERVLNGQRAARGPRRGEFRLVQGGPENGPGGVVLGPVDLFENYSARLEKCLRGTEEHHRPAGITPPLGQGCRAQQSDGDPPAITGLLGS